jgi:hypothetical protein
MTERWAGAPAGASPRPEAERRCRPAARAAHRLVDLRLTTASLWLATGADPKVVQRVLGHATAAMAMDLHGHLVDASLWQAARLIGGTTGGSELPKEPIRTENESGRMRKNPH